MLTGLENVLFLRSCSRFVMSFLRLKGTFPITIFQLDEQSEQISTHALENTYYTKSFLNQ